MHNNHGNNDEYSDDAVHNTDKQLTKQIFT